MSEQVVATDDVTPSIDRYVRVSGPGGAPVVDLRPTNMAEWTFEEETYPEEPLVSITFTFHGGVTGEFRPAALRAALDEVERIREDADG